MGTRSLTIITDGTKEIAVMYRQHDGYPDGHGAELARFLDGMRIVNGLGPDDCDKVANGAACLAAQIVGAFKTGPGNLYLYPAGTRDVWEDYTYSVIAIAPRNGAPGSLAVRVESDGKDLFSGDVASFQTWCSTPPTDDD